MKNMTPTNKESDITKATQGERSEHTPGLWTVSEVTRENSEFHSLVGNPVEGWVVAGVYKHPKLRFNGTEHVHVNTADRKARALADARLIAVAPELLKMVKDMNYAFYYHGDRKHLLEVMQHSKELIAKAEGR